jgi:hypothetical protein
VRASRRSKSNPLVVSLNHTILLADGSTPDSTSHVGARWRRTAAASARNESNGNATFFLVVLMLQLGYTRGLSCSLPGEYSSQRSATMKEKLQANAFSAEDAISELRSEKRCKCSKFSHVWIFFLGYAGVPSAGWNAAAAAARAAGHASFGRHAASRSASRDGR